MSPQSPHASTSWRRLLALFTVASFIETMFWGQMGAFTPLYLPHLGISLEDVPVWTGAIAAISNMLGIPFLPLWGALADRYARHPIIVRSFVAHLVAGVVTLLAGNIWVFVIGRAAMSLALGNSGLMMTTLSERTRANASAWPFRL
jgi:MFS transporter, DHA1 family, multidrug resistance protein